MVGLEFGVWRERRGKFPFSLMVIGLMMGVEEKKVKGERKSKKKKVYLIDSRLAGKGGR